MTNDKVRALAEQIETSVNALAAETDAVRKSELFMQWLNAMAKFRNYSLTNQILISIQCPTASRVAGFHAWKTLGRHVRKEEKGIAIFAPCVYRKKTEPDNDDSSVVQHLRGFKVAYVFDLASTEGEPLPLLEDTPAAGGEDLLPKLEAAAAKLAVQLEYLEIPEQSVQGYSTGGRIVIRQSLSTAQMCGVVTHELAHELLHQRENRPNANNKSRSQRELEAEATAYVVMRHFGIEHVASNYLATYNVDGQQLRESLETISGAAKQLIAAIEGGNEDAEAARMAEPPEREESAA